mmetsp:Transcript_92340/g.183367  ORF Transcript_92340/g.183367 Transcript_92340/m.183367 type:complete len:153 (-) Transcript_92340:63-521(-)
MAFLGRFAGLCLVLAAPHKAHALTAWADPPKRTVIHKPNVDTPAQKASKAMSTYMDASKKRDGIWEQAVDSKEKAPAMYPSHLGKLVKANDAASEALEKATELQGKAVDTVQKELKDLTKKYEGKEKDLKGARYGEDFKAEAASLKLKMSGA